MYSHCSLYGWVCSAGSPLSINGFKKTINCKPAKVILADLDLIASAPQEMVLQVTQTLRQNSCRCRLDFIDLWELSQLTK